MRHRKTVVLRSIQDELNFNERNRLIKKMGYGGKGLTRKEEIELSELEESIMNLPTCDNSRDQESLDLISSAARLIENKGFSGVFTPGGFSVDVECKNEQIIINYDSTEVELTGSENRLVFMKKIN